MAVERDGVAGQYPAGNPSDAALRALSEEIGRLRGELYEANLARADAVAARVKAEREEQEWRGVVETFGRAERWFLADKDQERIILTMDRWTLMAAENPLMLFVEKLRDITNKHVDELRTRRRTVGRSVERSDTAPAAVPPASTEPQK